MKNKNLIAISGHMGSGKDTVAEIINLLLVEKDKPSYENRKFSYKVKKIASILTGFPVEKFEDRKFKESIMSDEWGTVKPNILNSIGPFENISFNHLITVRKFLQTIGTEAMRDGLHKDVWINALFSEYNFNCKPGTPDYPNWVITDLRFKNELEAIRARGGITIRINRNGFKDIHISERELDKETFDYVINNNGSFEKLVKKVRKILNKENII